jgi:hypothetical protein
MPQPGLDGGNTVGTLLPTETVHSQSILLSGETLGELRWLDSRIARRAGARDTSRGPHAPPSALGGPRGHHSPGRR